MYILLFYPILSSIAQYMQSFVSIIIIIIILFIYICVFFFILILFLLSVSLLSLWTGSLWH